MIDDIKTYKYFVYLKDGTVDEVNNVIFNHRQDKTMTVFYDKDFNVVNCYMDSELKYIKRENFEFRLDG